MKADPRLACAPGTLGAIAARAAEARRLEDKSEQKRAHELDRSLDEPRGRLRRAIEWVGDLPARANDAAPTVIACAVLVLALLLVLRLRFLRNALRRASRWGTDQPGFYESWDRRVRRWIAKRLGRLAWRLSPGHLHVEKFDSTLEADGATVAGLLRESIGSIDAAGPRVDLAAERADDGDTLEQVGQALKGNPYGAVASVLIPLARRLLPRDGLYVRGRLLPAGQRGLGLTLWMVAGGGQVRAKATLWEDDYAPGSRQQGGEIREHAALERLALVGAAWAEHQALSYRRRSDLGLSTRNLDSYILFRAGVDAATSRWPEGAARTLFARSVQKDPDNRPAVFDLAVAEMRAGDYPHSLARLADLENALGREREPCEEKEPNAKELAAKKELPRRAGQRAGAKMPERKNGAPCGDEASRRRRITRDPLFYQAGYNVAAGHVHAHLESTPGTGAAAHHLERAEMRARELLREVWCALEELPGRERPADLKARWDDALHAVEGSLLVLLAGIWMSAWNGRDGGYTGTPRAHSLGRTELLRRLDEVRLGKAESVPEDYGAMPDDLLGYLQSRPELLTDRARYNVACLLSRHAVREETGPDERGRLFEAALRELAYAVEIGILNEWAKTDPGLEPLRVERHDEFWALIREPPPALELGGLEAVGARHARRMSAAGIELVEHLIDRLGGADAINRLARDLSVEHEQLEQWLGLVEMVDRVGIRPVEANMLGRAGVRSLAELACQDPKTLHGELVEGAAAERVVDRPPSPERVEKWVARAKEAEGP